MSITVRKTLSFNEEKDINSKIEYLEDVKDGVEIQQGVKPEVKDTKMLEAKLKHLKVIKEKYGVTRVEGRERIQAEKEVQKLEDRMKTFWGGRFPTFKEHWIKPKDGGIGYIRYVEQIRKNNASPEYNGLVTRWKTLKRMINPEDPHASNTLQLYRE